MLKRQSFAPEQNTHMERKKHAGGRPKIDIPLNKLIPLCERQASDDELAAYFGCTTRTIEMRKRDPEFKAAMMKGRAHGKIRLRSELFDQALSGKNPTALVFACKSILGLSDRVELQHVGKDGKAEIEVKQTAKREDIDLMDKFLTAVVDVKINGSQGAEQGTGEPITA